MSGPDRPTDRSRTDRPRRRILANLLLTPFLSEARRKEILDDLEELRAARTDRAGPPPANSRTETHDPAGIQEGRGPFGFLARSRSRFTSALRYWIDLITLPFASRELDQGLEASARASARLPWAHRLGSGADSVLADVRFSVRSHLRTPLPSLVILGTIALALGANTAIFSFADALFLRSLAVPHADRLVVLFHQSQSDPDQYSNFSYPDFVEIRDQNQVLDGLAGYSATEVEMGDGPDAEPVEALLVSGNYFQVMDRAPALGRSFLPEEDRTPESHPVAVISHTLWQNRFDGSPGALGSSLTLNGRAFTVIGVAPEDMPAPDLEARAQIWVPFMMHRTLLPNFRMSGIELFYNRGTHWMNLLGRLRGDTGLEAARASLQSLAREQARLNPDTNRDWTVAVVPAAHARTGPPSNSMPVMITWLLAIVVGLVLLIACANVANLLLARSEMRQQEMGLRLAMGAGRWRLVRQVLTESLLLAGVGAGAGLLLALWSTDLLAALGATLGPGVPQVRLDARVAGFAMGLALVTAVAFGTLPALQASTVGATWARRGSRVRRGSGVWSLRWKQALIVVQVALSLVLLVGAGLTLRTVWNLQNVPLGFDVDDVSVVSLDLSRAIPSEEEGLRAQQRILNAVAELPGVEAVTLARVTPFSRWRMARDILWEPANPEEPRTGTNVDLNVVGPDFFRTLRIPMVEGRGFTRDDGPAGPGVAVVNRALAQRLWPDQSAVGRRLWTRNPNGPDWELRVVGVVENGRYHRSWRTGDRPFLFLPAAQDYAASASLLVRHRPGADRGGGVARGGSGAENGGTDSPVERVVLETVPGLSRPEIAPLADAQAASMARERTTARLLALFGILGLAIAAMGVYGVVSYSVSRRFHEIGVRIAVGARGADVSRIVLYQSAVPVVLGVILGAVLALPAVPLMTGLLYQVQPVSLPTFSVVAAVLVVVGILASIVPARRATRIDPLKILTADG